MKRSLDRVSDPYPVASATLLIGQNKGKEPANRRGFCASKPKAFSKAQVDRTVRDLRIGEIARRPSSASASKAARALAEKQFAASRISQRGWYKGQPEASVAYVFHHDDSIPGEATPAEFRHRMEQLAEDLTAVLCQDSVIVTFDTPGEKATRFVDTNAPEDAVKRREAQIRRGR